MPDGKIEGGYILLSRKIIESEIWRKPPLYLKVWIWLLGAAQHKEYKQLKRGQLFASINDIRTDVAWYVGYRKETPTKDQIFQILEWMRNASAKATTGATTKAPMITTTKATHGIFIKIENYCVYQDPKNYESNTGSNDRSNNENSATPNNINKNVKNVKNIKRKTIKKKTLSDFAYKIADEFHDYQMKNCPVASIKNWNRENWADTIDKLMRIDGYKQQTISDALGFAVSDDFWSKQIISLASLRKKGKNDLTKFDNLVIRMERNR
ncbi:MAG TPA: hypothetical protein DHM42_09825 [Clostridiales bacterium]|nr:hypothetical protein [Clostridiales bacterium]